MGNVKKTELNQTKTKTKTSLACPVDMEACAASFVCNKATQKIGGKWSWSSSNSANYKYVAEAKKRGLSCGVPTSTKPVSKVSVKPVVRSAQTTKQTLLAMNVLKGYGVKEDKPKALSLFLLSAKERDPRALFWLGKMYQDGDGVLKNYKKAYMWFSLATLNGYSQIGADARNEIENLLDARSLIEAQDLSLQCTKQGYQDC